MSSTTPTNAHPETPGPDRGRTLKIAAIVVALIVVISGIAFAVSRNQGGPVAATPAPGTSSAPATESPQASPTAAAPSSAKASTAAASASAAPASGGAQGCTTATGLMADPKRLKIDNRGVDSPMITVGKDSDGNPGAPPASASNTTAWYNGSPEIGSDKGNVILTIHTYQQKNGANALGNKLYSDSGLKPGDILRISDASGKQVCYRYTGNTKVWVKSYDPSSGVFHNLTGPPQLAIMICWDHNDKTNEWDSRIIFYAALVPVGQ